MSIIEKRNEIAEGFCWCGCGQATSLALQTSRKRGRIRGQPLRFISGHSLKALDQRGEKSPHWRGGKTISAAGYVLIRQPDHPSANKMGTVAEHVLIAERALGKALPAKARVHHVDENKSNNRNDNLVICQDNTYHLLLHLRTRALKACGHASWRRCGYCRQWGNPENLTFNGSELFHADCRRQYRRKPH